MVSILGTRCTRIHTLVLILFRSLSFWICFVCIHVLLLCSYFIVCAKSEFPVSSPLPLFSKTQQIPFLVRVSQTLPKKVPGFRLVIEWISPLRHHTFIPITNQSNPLYPIQLLVDLTNNHQSYDFSRQRTGNIKSTSMDDTRRWPSRRCRHHH